MFRTFSEHMQKQRARTDSLMPNRASLRPHPLHARALGGVGGGGPEGETARHKAASSSPLLLHALRTLTEHARFALDGDPKHHAA